MTNYIEAPPKEQTQQSCCCGVENSWGHDMLEEVANGEVHKCPEHDHSSCSKPTTSHKDRRSSWGDMDSLLGQFMALPTSKDFKSDLDATQEEDTKDDASLKSHATAATVATEASRRKQNRRKNSARKLGIGEASPIPKTSTRSTSSATSATSTTSSTTGMTPEEEEKVARRARRRRKSGSGAAGLAGAASEEEETPQRRSRSRSRAGELGKRIARRLSKTRLLPK